MVRERFEESKEVLKMEVLDLIKDHFSRMDRGFDMAAFLEESCSVIECVVENAHFHGAEVFPIDIPIKVVSN